MKGSQLSYDGAIPLYMKTALEVDKVLLPDTIEANVITKEGDRLNKQSDTERTPQYQLVCSARSDVVQIIIDKKADFHSRKN